METAEPAKRANIREMVEMGESQRLGTLVEVKELGNIHLLRKIIYSSNKRSG